MDSEANEKAQAGTGRKAQPDDGCCRPRSARCGEESQPLECGADCDCHAPSELGKTRRVIGLIILLAAALLVGRAITKSQVPTAKPAESDYALPAEWQSDTAPVPHH